MSRSNCSLFVSFVLLTLALVQSALAGSFEVVGPKNPKPWESTAVKDLDDYLRRVSGGDVSVEGVGVVRFHVGDTDFAAAKGMGGGTFADEEWAVRSFDGDIVINGGGTRGCLYGVYSFLEDKCGIRWWNDDEEYVPEAKPRAFGRLDLRGRPKFFYRDIYREPKSSPKTAVRNRLNGNGAGWIPVGLGGGCEFGPPGHCHNWNNILPFEKYGKEHPEWYSFVDGRRVGGQHNGQLCLACPGLAETMAEKLEEFIRRGEAAAAKKGVPAPKLYDISMNDNHCYCQCEACKASQEKHGVSGDQILFVNKVAAIVGKRHPDYLFSTFAYYEGEAVPKTEVRAADNVIVKLCNTRQNMAADIREPGNEYMLEQLGKWGSYTKNLFVWEYAITFDRVTHGFPFANEFYLGKKIRCYDEHGVKGMLIEQERPAGNDFYAVKFWTQCKMLEDPTRDPKAVLLEAMNGYYGPAAPHLLKLRLKLDRLRRERNGRVTWFALMSEFMYVRESDYPAFDELWRKAADAVKDDPVLSGRVRKSRIGYDRMKDLNRRLVVLWSKPEPGVSEVPFLDFRAENSFFQLKGKGFKVVDDATASTGKAIFMPYGDDDHLRLPFAMGVYSDTKRQTIVKNWDEPLGKGYEWYDLGDVLMPPSYYIFVNRSWTLQLPVSLPEVIGRKNQVKARVRFSDEGIFFDRLAVVPREYVHEFNEVGVSSNR